jgi:hypothetical protein
VKKTCCACGTLAPFVPTPEGPACMRCLKQRNARKNKEHHREKFLHAVAELLFIEGKSPWPLSPDSASVVKPS